MRLLHGTVSTSFFVVCALLFLEKIKNRKFVRRSRSRFRACCTVPLQTVVRMIPGTATAVQHMEREALRVHAAIFFGGELNKLKLLDRKLPRAIG